jgi:hypothetical protein
VGLTDSEKSGGGGAVTVSETAAVRVSEPLVPVMVSAYAPVAVVAAVVSVRVELLVAGLGLKVAVVSADCPLTLRLTEPEKPFEALMLTMYVVELPCTTDCEVGLAASEKSGGGVTFSAVVALCASVPLVPVMVRVELAMGVLDEVVTVITELLAVGLTLKLAVAPEGRPLALRLTEPLKPFRGVTVTV